MAGGAAAEHGRPKKRLEALADHLLGYGTDDEPETVKWGPQPYAGRVSLICEAFGCSPAEAERQDAALVDAVLDYRAAVAARDLFNDKDRRRGFEALAANPYLVQMLAWMRRAQDGRPLDGGSARQVQAEGMQVAQEYRNTPDSETEPENDV